jgi:uncharacterized membrane protein YkvA (DUF1232 family)
MIEMIAQNSGKNRSDAEHEDFYKRLRKRIVNWADSREGKTHRWTKILLTAPDFFHLLIRLAANPDVPLGEKGKLAAAVAYFISPLDLLPELFLGSTGFLDDIVLSAYVLNSLINHCDPAVLKKHWAGDEDVLYLIQHVLDQADRIVGSGLFSKLRKVLK